MTEIRAKYNLAIDAYTIDGPAGRMTGQQWSDLQMTMARARRAPGEWSDNSPTTIRREQWAAQWQDFLDRMELVVMHAEDRAMDIAEQLNRDGVSDRRAIRELKERRAIAKPLSFIEAAYRDVAEHYARNGHEPRSIRMHPDDVKQMLRDHPPMYGGPLLPVGAMSDSLFGIPIEYDYHVPRGMIVPVPRDPWGGSTFAEVADGLAKAGRVFRDY